MKYRIALLALAFALTASTTPLYGQGRGGGQGKKTTAGAPQGGAKADRARPVAAKAPKVAADAARPKKASTQPTTTEARVKRSKPPASSTTTATTVTEVTSTTPTTVHVKNPKLEARLLAKLPGVTDIQTASAGFKNWGQFVAAVHASDRLGISFETLKATMTGITPATTPGGTPVQTPPMSLGQAVQALKGTSTTSPTAGTGTLTPTQIQAEVKAAEDAAAVDLRQTRAN